MPEPFIAIIALEIIAIIIVLILYIIEYRRDKALHERKEQPLLDELREKNANILQEAVEKSQQIIASAENQSLKTVADASLKSKEVEGQVEAELVSFKNTVEQKFTQEAQKAIDDFNTYLRALETKTTKTQTEVENTTKQKVNEFIEKFEQNLSDFILQTQQKSLAAIDLELVSARGLIETYKEQQIKIINENIMAMLEKTLSLVLAKKMSLKEHMDLIYDSLEKAKVEKFIV